MLTRRTGLRGSKRRAFVAALHDLAFDEAKVEIHLCDSKFETRVIVDWGI